MPARSKSRLFVAVVLLFILIQSACVPTLNTGNTGVIQGVVYGDLNGNGIVDPGEGPLSGVIVSLSGCGSIISQTTGNDGAFHFAELPGGTCFITMAKTGWLFSGSTPSLGYPIPVASNPSQASAVSLSMAPVTAYIPTAVATSTELPSSTPLPATQAPTMTATAFPTATETLTLTAAVATTTTPAAAPILTAGSQDVNCRYGPGVAWMVVNGLTKGESTPLLGKNQDGSWWMISLGGVQCWVSGLVTSVSGDTSGVPVATTPSGVTTLTASTPATVHGTCGSSNPTTFTGSITVNGPVKVVYHWEIYTRTGTLKNSSSDEEHVFLAAGTFNSTLETYLTTCGNYYMQLVVTSPNVLSSSEADFSVVHP
jgi:uncharacterized protein YraI/uncharacterized protein YceK